MTDVDRRTFLSSAAGTVAAMALVPNLNAFASYSLNAPLRVGVVGVGRQGR